jgi:hypothetical protein
MAPDAEITMAAAMANQPKSGSSRLSKTHATGKFRACIAPTIAPPSIGGRKCRSK